MMMHSIRDRITDAQIMEGAMDSATYNDGSMPEPTLRASGLTRTFGSGEMKTCALSDVQIELYPGQVSLLMGPSGSGKSTLLAVLSKETSRSEDHTPELHSHL